MVGWTIHSNQNRFNIVCLSTTITLFVASQKIFVKEMHNELIDERKRRKPKYSIGDLVRTVDTRFVFTDWATTNWIYVLWENGLFTVYSLQSETHRRCTNFWNKMECQVFVQKGSISRHLKFEKPASQTWPSAKCNKCKNILDTTDTTKTAKKEEKRDKNDQQFAWLLLAADF